RLMLMLSVPATVGLMVLARPIIQVIFERGEFTADSTTLVAGALLCYAPGIVGYSIVKIASPCFYAMKDAKTPITVSLITIAVNLILNLTLERAMGFTGLALGTAIAANINALLLLVLLSGRLDGVDAGRMISSFVRIALAACVMGAAAWWLDSALADFWPGTALWIRIVRLLATIGASMGVLAVAAWLLRIDELRQAVARIKDRTRR